MTVELWIRPSANRAKGALVSNLNGCRAYQVTAGFEFGLKFGSSSSNKPTFTFFVEVPGPDGGSRTLDFEAGQALEPDVWHHVALVFEGAAGSGDERLWVYADGSQIGTYSNVNIGERDSVRYLSFGQRAGCLSDYYRGELEAARVYQRALTLEELSAALKLGQVP